MALPQRELKSFGRNLHNWYSLLNSGKRSLCEGVLCLMFSFWFLVFGVWYLVFGMKSMIRYRHARLPNAKHQIIDRVEVTSGASGF
jgi:hypothetical protein